MPGKRRWSMFRMICDLIQTASALLIALSALLGVISWIRDRREERRRRQEENDMMRLYEGMMRAIERSGGNVVVIDPLENPYAYRLACMLVEKGLLKKIGREGFSPAFLITME